MDNIKLNVSGEILGTGGPLSKPAKSPETPGDILSAFGDALSNQIQSINKLQSEAEQAAQIYAVGGPMDVHNVMLATEKAGIAMQLAVQVRNKLMAAYQELNRMQV